MMQIPYDKIDNSWSLFLDRDGVINHEKKDDYIHHWGEFKFYDGVLDAMKEFAKTFNRIIVVTNQRGIGRGLTQPADLDLIHENMTKEIISQGGKLDAIYVAPDINNDSPNRKPNPGMGLQAIKDFPHISPAKSIMVGNTLSDMEFGRNMGMYTVFLATTRPEVDRKDARIDACFNSLLQFARRLHLH
ncbi:MAG: HAD-IIIA family hydrolase [Ferruginibacter sp.]|nr:HAD-IIIA family hydrolase [Ferruginibacter sp.]